MKALDALEKFSLPGRLVLFSCVVVAAGAVYGCTKQDARTVNSVADMACELFATQEAEAAQKAGINIGDVATVVEKACNAKDANRTIVDALLAAKREGEAERAGAMGIATDADD